MYILRLTMVGLVMVGVSYAADKPVATVVSTNTPKATLGAVAVKSTPTAPAKALPTPAPAKVISTALPKVTPLATAKVTPPTLPVATAKVTSTVTPTAVPKATPASAATPKATPTATPKATPAVTPVKVTPVAAPRVTPTAVPKAMPTGPVTAAPAVVAKATPIFVPTPVPAKAAPVITPVPTSVAVKAAPTPTPAPAPTAAAANAQNKKPPVIELIKPATDLMSQAQEAYIGSDSKKAIALFREALVVLVKLERDYPQWAPTPTFSPVRFRKAICETEIERVLLEEAQASSRTIAVTDTRELEKMRQDRKKAAETNRVVVTTRKLNSKSSGEVVDEVAVQEDATKRAVKSAEPKGPVKIPEELDWAKDMIQVERFADAETALIKVLKADAENNEARFLLALAKVQQGKSSDALIMLTDALEDTPGDEATLLLAAGAQLAQGAYTKAMELLDAAMKANPHRPDAYFNMAWLLLDMRPDALTAADLYYRQAVKLGLARNRDMERRLGIKQ